MSTARIREVARLELKRTLCRPAFWFMVAIFLFVGWGLSSGHLTVSAGDTSVGGKKSFITSEFAQAKYVASLVFIVLTFVMAGIAGLAIHRDDEHKVGEILHATPLRPAEYVIGKYGAGFLVGVLLLLVSVLSTAFFNHAVPNSEAIEIRGPFDLWNYLRPALAFGLPPLLFVTGVAFTLGTRTKNPVLVYLLPVAITAVLIPLWEWSPSWLSTSMNRLLGAVDPSGLRWMQETWVSVDRGVDFYNTTRVPFDPLFVLSRLGFCALGLLGVGYTAARYGRTLRGSRRGPSLATATAAAPRVLPTAPGARAATASLAGLQMRSRLPSAFTAIREVARVDARALLKTPSLYLFVPLIALQVVSNSTLANAPLDVELLATPGMVAVGAMNTLAVLASLLILFHAVESLNREQGCRLDPIHGALPVPPLALLFGKALALTVVPLLVYAGSLLGAFLAIAVDGKVPFSIGPFALVWGAILLPTFFLFGAFAMATFAICRDRLTAWTIGIAAIAVTLYQQLATDHMSWVWNWTLWDSLRWSDISVFEIDRKALVLNRVLWTGVGVFFVALAARFSRRREPDPSRTLLRLRPRALVRSVATLLPWLVWPFVAGVFLHLAIEDGFAGDAAKKHWKDYWGKNVSTFAGAPTAMTTGIDMTVKLWPETRGYAISGNYRLETVAEMPLGKIAITPGYGWQDVSWTLDGTPTVPEDRAGLLLFGSPQDLATGRTVTLGFSYRGEFPAVATKNGGGASVFVLPSGVVMTSFEPTFFPMVGWQQGLGVDKDNKNDPKDYRDDFYKTQVPHWMHLRQPFPVKTTIEGPANFVLNGVGVITSDTVADGRRAVTWETDHPIDFVNVVAGPLVEKKGEGVALWYHPGHEYNADEMVRTLEAARRWYSEWFCPFPWRELKVTEFPALASYAQGFASNITFSEAIGFLTATKPELDLPFLVTAHESAHQWWGNLFSPGDGPGADFLSEGMAHFSTVLLFEHEQGELARMEFLKRIENSYAEGRNPDGEPPIATVRDAHAGDKNVKYDKGGFVMWMLVHHMGRENCLAGLRELIRRYANGPDFALPPDLVATLREFAQDKAAYDAFTRQWFFEVVAPEFKVTNARRDGDVVRATVKNVGTGTVEVEVAATMGPRLASDVKQEDGDDEGEKVAAAKETAPKDSVPRQNPKYRDARTSIRLGPGQEAEVAIPCDFKATKVVVDPDVNVLQLNRPLATADVEE